LQMAFSSNKAGECLRHDLQVQEREREKKHRLNEVLFLLSDGDWWYVIEGQLESGRDVELWRDGQIHRWNGNWKLE
jgi:hypothetical protein